MNPAGMTVLDIGDRHPTAAERRVLELLEAASVLRTSIGEEPGALLMFEVVVYTDDDGTDHAGLWTRSGTLRRHILHRASEYTSLADAHAAYEAAVRLAATEGGITFAHTDVPGVPVTDNPGGAA